MNSWVKVGFGLSLLWYGVLRGAQAVSVKLHSYQFRAVDLLSGTVSLDLNLAVYNPLLVGVTIKGIRGDVYAQSVKIGTTDTSYNYNLSGRQTHILPVQVDLDMQDSLVAFRENVRSGDVRTLTVGFDGKLFVGNIGIPVKLELNYNDLFA